MTKYKYDVVYSSKFKKSLKKIAKQGKDLDKLLKPVIEKLAYKEELDMTYNNHKLTNYGKGEYWECHLGNKKSDWLLIYQYIDEKLILYMVDTGSHSELFN